MNTITQVLRQLCCISSETEASTELQTMQTERNHAQQEVQTTAQNPLQNPTPDLSASEHLHAFQQKKEIYMPGRFIFAIPDMEILRFFVPRKTISKIRSTLR